MTSTTEQVVLLDSNYRPIGTADKASVHDENTPLHLAFSCYLFSDEGQVLLTRRSLDKEAWPGVWTNSFCGHPLPKEAFSDAVHRRADYELGAKVLDIRCVCGEFRYCARDNSGVVENEFCPVFQARLNSELAPRASEVADYAWIDFDDLLYSVQMAPFAFSPWMHEQLSHCELVANIKQGLMS
ncbi:isopentenyl-diphosphate Delta-isomerase [Vibrio europaeus]|uniref:isopentenyl-diphosphate Delta-isomerase n=1 Tax=Vibrio europaeus TaxID=300876 RepID=UPI00233ED400|nr:isopentenyl-diphosphate Delta-isomerase [Vibrio europaeus]MDC5808039.1 isopentenyl-diphosphate Delta-isomerase [Vibrio europaeus]MDC5825245.1 isopentenyl-diphosphate Delta-isomerase [Vibrio europaeus]MDC5830865.1 isopentenyl-diphosphate Delta-isomerase [Vibrio europaeus]MDC5833820.1 isopentenyl-diphosphate Delta-isomerase [Vibrio europaeus]